MTRAERFENILSYFGQAYPQAGTELSYGDPYELLVAVILSAQCTDVRVNKITPAFFESFPDVATLASASVDDIHNHIRSCSYPNSKSRYLSGMARTLVEEFDGKVPEETRDLMQLPGVGRKTAHVIASVVYNKPLLAVDTHVFRVSDRLGLTLRAKTPLEAENQLVQHIPKRLIAKAHHWLILHGRYVCKARKPLCSECPLTQWCAYFERKGL